MRLRSRWVDAATRLTRSPWGPIVREEIAAGCLRMAESGYLVSDETRKAVWDKAHSTECAERYYQRLGNENRRRDRLWSIPALIGFCFLLPASVAILSGASNLWIVVASTLASTLAFFLMVVTLVGGRFGGVARRASVWTALAETYGRVVPEFRALLDAIDLNEIEDGEARGKLSRLTRKTETAIERRVKSARNWRGVVPDDLRREPPLPEPAPAPPRPTPPPPPPEHPHLRSEDRRGHALGNLENRMK